MADDYLLERIQHYVKKASSSAPFTSDYGLARRNLRDLWGAIPRSDLSPAQKKLAQLDVRRALEKNLGIDVVAAQQEIAALAEEIDEPEAYECQGEFLAFIKKLERGKANLERLTFRAEAAQAGYDAPEDFFDPERPSSNYKLIELTQRILGLGRQLLEQDLPRVSALPPERQERLLDIYEAMLGSEEGDYHGCLPVLDELAETEGSVGARASELRSRICEEYNAQIRK